MDFGALQSRNVTASPSQGPTVTAAASRGNGVQPTPDLSLAALHQECFFILAAVYQRQMMGAVASLSTMQKAGLPLVEITNGPLTYTSRPGMQPTISTMAQTSVTIGRSSADPNKKALCRVAVNTKVNFQYDESSAAETAVRISDQDALIQASRQRYEAPYGGELAIEPMTDPHVLLFPELGPHWWHEPNDWYSMFVAPAISSASKQYLALCYPVNLATSPPVLPPGVFRVSTELKSFFHAGYGIRSIPEDFVLNVEAIPTGIDTIQFLARYQNSSNIMAFDTRFSRVLINRLLVNSGWRLEEKTAQLEVWQRLDTAMTDKFMSAAAPMQPIGELIHEETEWSND